MTEEGPPDVAVAVQLCLNNQTEDGQISFYVGQAFVNAVLQITEAGLVGNRAIPSTGLWNVVLAMERAFPVLMSPGVDTVRPYGAQCIGTASKLWIQQAAQDGSLAFLVSKVRSQPQVYTAYLSTAPMRSKEATVEFEAAVLPLKGVANFAELNAARTNKQTSTASEASGAAGPKIETRDAAPQAPAPEQPGAGQEPASGHEVGTEEPASSRLSQMWDAQWSRLPISHAHSSASPASTAASGQSRKAQDPGKADPTIDAGHISIGMSAPSLPGAACQLDSQPEGLAARLEVEETSEAGEPHVKLYLDVKHKQVMQGGVQNSRQSRLAQHLDQVMQSQASAAALSGIHSLAGLLKAPPWTRQEPASDAAASEKSTAKPPPAKEASTANDVSGAPAALVAASDAAQQACTSVAVEIRASEAGDGPEASGQPCSVTLRVLDDASAAAAEQHPAVSGSAARSRIGAFSGLFRSSRAANPPTQRDPGSIPSLGQVTGESNEQAPKSPAAPSRTETAAPGASSAPEAASAGERQNPAWAVAGAIGSLYGYVSHAADSALRPGQQAGSSEAVIPSANRGSEASTSSAAPASSRSPRAPATPSKQEEEEASAGEELALRLKTAAATVLQAGVGPGADILGPEDADLQAVCSGVEALLRHGLRPAHPRDKWAQYLPGRRSGALDMLQEAQRLAIVEEGKGWGLEGVEALVGGHSSEAALQMWIRSSLNERALGSRLCALCNSPSLLQSWYSRTAVLRQEEAAGQLLGLLMGLDAVKVLLPVETHPAEQPTNGSVGFLAGVTNLLPGRSSNAAAIASLIGPQVPHMASPKARKRTRAVTIGEALEEPRPNAAAAAAAAADRSPAASDLLSSSLGALLLSPMSSTDISAEPLSPTTTAAFQALRARHLAGLSAHPSPGESDLLTQLLQQQKQGLSPAPESGALHAADSGDAADARGLGESTPELAAFLDDLLATPEDSMFAPQLESQPPQLLGDPGKDPPPWQPLKPHGPRPTASAGEESPGVHRETAGAAAAGSPFLAAQEVVSYNSAEERRKAAEAAAAASERMRSRLARRRVTSEGSSEPATPLVAAAQAQQEDVAALSTSGSISTSMLGARSQEGDFYRLLESEEPAPRRSFHLDKDEQLPRSFSISARGGQPQASETAEERAEEEDGAALVDGDLGAQEEERHVTPDADAQNAPANAPEDASVEDADALSPEWSHQIADSNEGHPKNKSGDQQQIREGSMREASVHEEFSEDESAFSAAAEDSHERTGEHPTEEPGSAEKSTLARQEPSAELSYSDLTALLSTPEADSVEPLQGPSTSNTKDGRPAELDRAAADGSPAGPAALQSGDPLQLPHEQQDLDGRTVDAGASQQASVPQPDPPVQPHANSTPAQEDRGPAPDEAVSADGSSVHADVHMPLPDRHPAAHEVSSADPLQDRAHLTPQSIGKGAAQAAGAAESGAGRQSAEQQQDGLAPEIREFLASQGLQHILEGEQMSMPELPADEAGDPLSPREHDSQTDANLLEDMNEILMLDLGGLGGFRSPLGSPPRAGSAHFSFDDPHHPPRPPDPEPLPPTWRVAEARVVGAATVTEGTAEYTCYSVEVTPADGGEAWTVQHRFKDFIALRSALTALVGAGGLPQCWADVSKARSVTGRHRLAPEVVAARQAMLDRCLVSVVAAGPPLAEAPPLLAFLAPADPHWDPPLPRPGTPPRASPGPGRDTAAAAVNLTRAGSEHASSASSSTEAGNRYGSLVRLLTEEPQKLVDADLMRLQRGQCAACRAPLPALVKQSGFLGGRSAATGPRRCEYNARLYCHECHRGDVAELPALVLHHWDFHPRPVSTMAADYLASIADRPLLCIGAVNPGLYARVPMLARAQDLRTRACKALAAARASGPEGADKAKRLLAGAGPRRYLLESPDFWAMRELVELSKGAFSRLPAWLEAAAARAASLATSALLTAAAEQQQRPARGGRR